MRGSSGVLVWPLTLSIGIGIALALRVGAVWSQLPDTMASHFGLEGQADAFMSKGPFFLFLAASVGGGVALVFVSAFLIKRLPSRWLNLPNREYWLATDARREAALDRIVGPMAWMGLATAVLLAVAVEFTIEANLNQSSFANDTFMAVMFGYLLCMLGLVVWMLQALSRLGDGKPKGQSHAR